METNFVGLLLNESRKTPQKVALYVAVSTIRDEHNMRFSQKLTIEELIVFSDITCSSSRNKKIWINRKRSQSTVPMSSGVFSVRIEKGLDFLGIGIEDHGEYVYLVKRYHFLEQFGMKDCNPPAMMPLFLDWIWKDLLPIIIPAQFRLPQQIHLSSHFLSSPNTLFNLLDILENKDE
jgi:hypothetical protein